MKNLSVNLFGILLLSAAAIAVSAQSDGSGRLAGTWDAVVQPRVCATGAVITTFKAAYLFKPGGTFSGVSSGTGSGGRGREQIGVWEYVGGNRYRFRIKAYLFDAAGMSSSYQIVNHDAVLSEDGLSWSSVGDSRTYDFNDVQINAGCSTITATLVADL